MHPKIDLADSLLREAVAAERTGQRLPDGVQPAGGGEIVVEVLFDDHARAATAEAIREAGGDPGQVVPGELIQSEVPVDELVELESDPAVLHVRPPLDYNEPAEGPEPVALSLGPENAGSYVGEQITKTGADLWHASGITGQGVKVGIIDSFTQPHYDAAVANGEIPAVSGTFCLRNGAPCNAIISPAPIDSRAKHGIGVAEAVIDMAPSAQIYFASAQSAADTQAAMNYFAAQGVKVVTRSETGRYDGPGNGTGPIASVIDNAVGQGMFYLNSAGNSAGRNGDLGTYWRATMTGPDGGAGWLAMGPGDLLMRFDCSYLNGLRWSDFGEGAGTTNYGLYVYDTPAGWPATPIASSNSANAAEPIERIVSNYSPACGGDGIGFAGVYKWTNGNAAAGDTLEFMTNGAEIAYPTNPFSAAGPMSDLNNPGAVSVGAVDPALGTTIADYSSEGPTNDGRMKPDLSAAACVRSLAYAMSGEGCFNGTSSATPVTAGAAALILSAGAASTPAEVKSVLMQSTTDRGTAGPDNVYGQGELLLPPPGSLDRIPPTIKALGSKGRSGKKARLRFRVSDNGGVTRETATVFRGKRKLKTLNSKFGPATGNRPYALVYKVPRSVAGRLKFCVVAYDEAGNQSPESCAKLKITR